MMTGVCRALLRFLGILASPTHPADATFAGGFHVALLHVRQGESGLRPPAVHCVAPLLVHGEVRLADKPLS